MHPWVILAPHLWLWLILLLNTLSWCSDYRFLPFAPQNETECAYYLRTGQCKFGGTCKFHHPLPSNMMVSYRGSPIYPTAHSPTTPVQQSYPGGLATWPLSRASYMPSSHWQGPSSYAPLILPQGVVSVQGWNTYNVRLTFYLCSLFFFSFLSVIIQWKKNSWDASWNFFLEFKLRADDLKKNLQMSWGHHLQIKKR